MRQGAEHITQVRGYVWYVFRDLTVSTGPAGEHPFGEETAVEDQDQPETTPVRLPDGVLDAWRIDPETVGLVNRSPGTAFLVLTETLKRPEVNAGWDVEPARLEPNFQVDQRGSRWVRLTRILATRDHDGQPVQEGEFEIDRTWQGSGRDRG